MADKFINELPVASLLTDAGLLVVYQDGKTQSIRGELIKQYAAQGVSQYVEEAKTAAQTAGDAAGEAQAAAEEAKGVALYPPQVNPDTGVWQTWDAAQQQYVDTDKKAEGPEGPAGSSIQSIERTSGTGAPGTTDTYTVTLTNGSTTTFQVYNGADCAGTGDFKADGSVPMTGVLQMAGHTISGLPAPVSDSDPVRKQDVPTLAADRQLSNLDTPQAALVNLGAGVRPNLVENWDFRSPINQRGIKDTIVQNGQYILDRWRVVYDSGASPKFDSQNGRISLDNSGGSGNLFFEHSVELKSIDESEQYIISILCDSGLYSSDIKADENRIYIQNSPFNCVIQRQSNKYNVQIGVSTGSVEQVISVKLERGISQTLAYKKSDTVWGLIHQPESDYSTQLLKCQRYYQLYSSAENRPSKAADCRPVMRIDPTQGTIVIDGVTYYYNDASL